MLHLLRWRVYTIEDVRLFYRTLTEILCIYRLLLFYVDLFFFFLVVFPLNVFHSSDAYTHSDFDTRVHIVFGLILLYTFFFSFFLIYSALCFYGSSLD